MTGPGAKYGDGASQDDMAKKYAENEEGKDVQAPAKGPEGPGTKLEPRAVGQDDGVAKELTPDAKMEKVEEKEPVKESDDADEDDTSKRYKEMEGDMGKMVEILEALKAKVDKLEEAVFAKKEAHEEPDGDEAKPANPEPPMTESKRLSNSFVEAVSVGPTTNSDKAFNSAVKKVLY
jgi:hypothetical protein